MKVLHFIELDGRTITVVIKSENVYPTHIETEAECIHSFPKTELERKTFKLLLIPNYNKYIVSKFVVPHLLRRIEVAVVSGYIEPLKGYAVFKPSLQYPLFINKMSGDFKEIYFKSLYESLKNQLSEIENQKGYIECINNINEIHKRYTEAINKYISLFKDALKITPDTAVLLESLLSLRELPSPPPAPPPKKGLLSRIIEKIKRLLGRKT